jgi:hypothetical protein
MAILIDFWLAGELFPTQTTPTDQVSYRLPYYTIQDQFAGSVGTAVPEDCSSDRGIQGIPRLHAVASSFSSTITNTAHGSSIPSPDSVHASRSEWLILPVMCGVCVQHDKRAVNDRSLIDTGRPTMVQHPIRLCLVSTYFSRDGFSPIIASNS